MYSDAGARAAREAAIQWARQWLARDDWVVLDTETTGLGPDAEIIEIAVLDPHGAPLLDTLVRPLGPIPPDATRVHGITDADVVDAPPFPEVSARLAHLLAGRTALIYNAAYDLRLLRQTVARHGIVPPPVVADCVMLRYAGYWGEPGRDGYRWQRLEAACARHGIVGGTHRARGDCLSTYGLVRFMASASEMAPRPLSGSRRKGE